MSDMNRSFAGSMPEFYDRYLVPLQFEPFALDLGERLKRMTSGEVLEVAAGTGVVTRALARTLPTSVRITATDLNPAMLQQAKSYPGSERVMWREADAMTLPFPDEAFDCVVCQFGVMFFPNKQAGFREAHRVLRPGGQYLFNVWGDRDGTARLLAMEVVGKSLSRDPASLTAPEYNDIDTVLKRTNPVSAGFIFLWCPNQSRGADSGGPFLSVCSNREHTADIAMSDRVLATLTEAPSDNVPIAGIAGHSLPR